MAGVSLDETEPASEPTEQPETPAPRATTAPSAPTATAVPTDGLTMF